MKYASLVCSILVLCFVGNSQAKPGKIYGENGEVWEYSAHPGSFFSREYKHNQCSVNVSDNGLTVWITAKDLSWKGKQLFQLVVLNKLSRGVVLITPIYKTAAQNDTRPLGPRSGEDATARYDIFQEKCAENAKRNLPDDVKKAFGGAYGIDAE